MRCCIVVYLVIAFGMAWAFWCIPLAFGLRLGSPFYMLVLLPGAFAPAVAAIVVRKWVTHEGFTDAGLRPRSLVRSGKMGPVQ